MKEVMIHPKADVQSVNIGQGTRIWQFCVVLAEAQIGEDCNINCQVLIENDVRIGNRVTLKPGVQIWDGPNATFTNDLFPKSGNRQFQLKRTLVKKGASIGANATILAGITIGEHALVGAGSVVTKDIPPHEIWIGNPAKFLRKND
jgi:acetyltransferase-like isoleucine patch superfamily enzyme